MRTRSARTLSITALLAGLTLAAGPPAHATTPLAKIAALPACDNQLSLDFDGEDGNFDGMSHSGRLLVLRNLGPAPCRIPGLPSLHFEDSAGHDLNFERQTVGLHPGPVVLPVGIAGGAEATATLRWVSGDVFTGHNCVTPARIAVQAGAVRLTASWPGGPLCGPAGKPVPYQLSLLRTDPVLP